MKTVFEKRMRGSSSGSSLTESVRDMFIPNDRIDELNNVKIGKGTYGFVEKGKMKQNDGEWIPVAIKYMHEKNDVNHLVKEARTMFQLKGHPHCVQVFGLFDCPRHGVGAVMEFMDCKSLADVLPKKNIAYTMDHFVSWMYQLSSAVNYFHSKDELHRDLKLQNLLLTKRYTILKVGDFGTFTPQRDSMKSMRGTPVTMAPEIFKMKPYNKKCDIYSIGIIMWQLIARREPYAISDANALLWNVAAEGKRPPEITCNQLLSDFYKRCWHEVPATRPDSSELLGYFTVLKKYYPNGDQPLLDEATHEPVRTPQPQNVVLSPSLRGHRRTGSDQSTLLKTIDSGISDPVSDDLRNGRSQSVAGRNLTASNSSRGSDTVRKDPPIANIFGAIHQSLRPLEPLEHDQESLSIYNQHIAQVHQLYDLQEELQVQLRAKHATTLQLKRLLEKQSLEEECKRLESLTEDALKKIQSKS